MTHDSKGAAMCMICQNGPAILVGVPSVGLVLARVRRALGVNADTTVARPGDPAVVAAESGRAQ